MAIREISNQMNESVKRENLRFHHLENCLNELEIYYNNQLAIFQIMKEIVKQGKKKAKKEKLESSLLENQLVELLNSYLFDQIACFRTVLFYYIILAVENHGAEYNKMLALQDNTEITKDFYLPMLSQPEKYLFYSSYTETKPKIIVYDTSHQIPEETNENMLKIYFTIPYISWTNFKAVKEGCIDLNLGDEVICHSQSVNGWRFGFNKTTDNVINKFKEKLPTITNNKTS
ncbi:LOW QUALITY PROTEIN: hypothetical protein MXB_4797 [Myxobolus squamalis]|nr:LOW QUALITY PROTEIN: hypothetical protein MXB_4797 [Myxobolus squamalis]